MEDNILYRLGYPLGYLLLRISLLNIHLMEVDTELTQAFYLRNLHFIEALSVYAHAGRTSLHPVELESLSSLVISLEPRLVDICEQAADLTEQSEGLIPLQILLLELQSHFLGSGVLICVRRDIPVQHQACFCIDDDECVLDTDNCDANAGW